MGIPVVKNENIQLTVYCSVLDVFRDVTLHVWIYGNSMCGAYSRVVVTVVIH